MPPNEFQQTFCVPSKRQQMHLIHAKSHHFIGPTGLLKRISSHQNGHLEHIHYILVEHSRAHSSLSPAPGFTPFLYNHVRENCAHASLSLSRRPQPAKANIVIPVRCARAKRTRARPRFRIMRRGCGQRKSRQQLQQRSAWLSSTRAWAEWT